MATNPAEQQTEQDKGIGVALIGHNVTDLTLQTVSSSGHNVAALTVSLPSVPTAPNLALVTFPRPSAPNNEPVEEEVLLCTPEMRSPRPDSPTFRGSSLMGNSPDIHMSSPKPSPRVVPAMCGPSVPSPLPLSSSPPASSGTSHPTTESFSYRPCSPLSWVTTRKSSHLHRPNYFDIAVASLPSPARRVAKRGDNNNHPSSPPRTRGFPARPSRERPFRKGGTSRAARVLSRERDWQDWRLNLPSQTPEGYTHNLATLHPWAPLVRPRSPRYTTITSDCVTSDLPLDIYRPIPPAGYHSAHWVRTLFPVYIRHSPSPSNKIPIMELQTLEAAIHFREESSALIHRTLNGLSREPIREQQQTPLHFYSSTLAPPVSGSSRPVLYQVVALGYGNGVILEAKDFFVVGPDRRDLHCIVLEQYAIDVTTNMRGFDKSLVSLKDLVWVYSLTPTRAALRDPRAILERSRIPRAAAIDPWSAYFFRVDRFAFITPHVQHTTGLGMVLHLVTRANRVTKFLAVFEGAPEAVVVTPSVCDPALTPVYQYSFVLAETRLNTSCAMRFSEPPVSIQARDQLCYLASQFLPLNTSEGVLPLRVTNLSPADADRITDRANAFANFTIAPGDAKRLMARLFNLSCSALAAMAHLLDDRAVHWVTLVRPLGLMCPLRLDFFLDDMPHEAGWCKGRFVDFWISGATHTTTMKVEKVLCDLDNKRIFIRIAGFTWNHSDLTALLQHQGRLVNGQVRVDGYVRLAKPTKGASSANEAISRMLHSVDRIESGTIGHQILEMVYRKQPDQPSTTSSSTADLPPILFPDTFRLKQHSFSLTSDQKVSLQLGLAGHPIARIQAAFGTGKTVLGAITAGLLLQHRKWPVIVTSTTNNTVAHFTNTLLAIDEFSQLTLLRYVSESAFLDESPDTPVDIHEILKSLGDNYGSAMTSRELESWQRFRQGRELYEKYVTDPGRSMSMTATEIEEYIIAEKDASDSIKKVVNTMFRVRVPDVLLLTTSSILNTTATGGLFKSFLDDRRVIIIDDASQVPEPVFASLTTMFPQSCQIYIGDAHQMRPHCKCPPDSNPALFGARSIMTVLADAPAVPKSTLVTTFRAHPALNALPNTLVYHGSLINGAAASERRLLLDRVRFPNPHLPFVLIDVEGSSLRAMSHSHWNEHEANTCTTLLDQLLQVGLDTKDLCVVTFYREQFRLLLDYATERQIEIATVDSIQGREKEAVILLTTRTDFTPDESSFIDDICRLNVALTRCRSGQFILGHAATLRTLPNWGAVVRWAEQANAVLASSHLLELFSP